MTEERQTMNIRGKAVDIDAVRRAVKERLPRIIAAINESTRAMRDTGTTGV